jgi:glutathione S-transferase
MSSKDGGPRRSFGRALAAPRPVTDDPRLGREKPMKLHHNVASPYVRKVMAVAIETGLRERIELVERKMSPVSPSAELNRDNPLGKIPCLVTDEGVALFDSRVICEYLDGLHDGPKMFPPAAPARWTALRRQAQGDGMLDAAVGTRYETFLRPEERRWPEWIDAQKQKFRRTLDALEGEAAGFGDAVDVGTITIGCALGYLDFRYQDENWHAHRPTLAAWWERFAQRPSMARTAPSEIW